MLSVKQGTIFGVFGMTRPGIEHQSPGPNEMTKKYRIQE